MSRGRVALLARGFALSLALVAFVEAVRLVSAAPFSATGLAGRWLLAAALLAAGYLLRPSPAGGRRSLWSWPLLALLAAGAVGATLYGLGMWAWAAWPALAGLYLALLAVAATWEQRGFVGRWLAPLLAAFAGALPVAAAQLESHFAEEEFFVALQAVALALYWLLLLLATRLMGRPAGARSGIVVSGLAPLAALLTVGLAAVLLVGRGYQRSFYPAEAPGFSGISEAEPFLCGQVEPDESAPDGAVVFDALLRQMEQNPHPGAADFGMLA
ncbi:MAG: hypothetical protein ACYC5O_14690, partial [Anaerolineae bacterium]